MRRLKLLLISISLIGIVLIILMENGFYRKPTLAKWKTLDWQDFQGIPIPYSNWAAVISSNIDLEYDEEQKVYRAYAYQDNMKSWRKKNMRYEDYSLRHEQYHFNITHLVAERLNEKLDSIGDDFYAANQQLLKHRVDLRNLQGQYDTETDHGSEYFIQKNWEYTLDSSLSNYLMDSSYLMEPTTGFTTHIRNDNLLKAYVHSSSNNTAVFGSANFAYGLNIEFYIYEYVASSKSDLDANLKIFLSDRNLLKGVVYDSLDLDRLYYLETNEEDTLTTLHNYYLKDNTIGSLKIDIEGLEDRSKFLNLAERIARNISIRDNREYWVNRFRRLALEASKGELFDQKDMSRESSESDRFIIYYDDSKDAFSQRIVELNADTLLFIYQPVIKLDSISELTLMIEDQTFSTLNPSLGIIPIDRSNLPNELFYYQIGHLLKKDSSEKYRKFYYQNMVFDPTIKED
ncbi:hypothetical protein [Roseivirga sp.]|uniref:hypothetical protein n=1 Tax=Roseivirga sp. TaxID=1964215 RepID=UPI003B52FB7F